MKIPAAKLHFSNKTAKELSKKDYDEHEKDLTQKFFIISHRNHGNHRKGFAQPCGMLLKRTQISQITQICFPFFRLLSVSSVINIYLRNLRGLHDLKPTHIFVSIGACRLRRSCRFFISHRRLFIISHRKHGNHRKAMRHDCSLADSGLMITVFKLLCFLKQRYD